MSLFFGLICALALAQEPQPPSEPLIGPQPAEAQPNPPEVGPEPASTAVVTSGTPPQPDPTYERLLGDQPPTPTPESPEALSLPIWVWPLAALLVLLVLGGRFLESRRRKSAGPPLELRLISRLSLGREGQLAVIEVADGAGAYRRLLVGLGGGAPRLVMELDSSTFESALVANGVPAEPRARPTESRPARPTPDSGPTERPAESRARPATSRPATPDARRPLAVRSDLIQEVLAEREGPLEGEPPAEDQEKPPAYTFRGLLG